MYEKLIYVLQMVIYVLKVNIFDPNSALQKTAKQFENIFGISEILYLLLTEDDSALKLALNKLHSEGQLGISRLKKV